MNRLFLAAIVIFFMWGASHSSAAIKGIPVTDDQYAHLFGSAYISKVCQDNDIEFIETIGIMMAIGVLKEIYDINSTGFNVGDIGWNVSGVFLAYSVDFVL